MYGEGVSREGELIDIASEINIIEKSGAWYSYKGEKLGQGKENVKELFKNNIQLQEEIMKQTREFYGITDQKQKKQEKAEK